MTELILIAIQAVSLVVILIIMAVMANTIAMTARERTAEYATLKALGFGPAFIGWLIVGESMVDRARRRRRRDRRHVSRSPPRSRSSSARCSRSSRCRARRSSCSSRPLP